MSPLQHLPVLVVVQQSVPLHIFRLFLSCRCLLALAQCFTAQLAKVGVVVTSRGT